MRVYVFRLEPVRNGQRARGEGASLSRVVDQPAMGPSVSGVCDTMRTLPRNEEASP